MSPAPPTRAASRTEAWKRAADREREPNAVVGAVKEAALEEGKAALSALPRIAARLGAIVASPALYVLGLTQGAFAHPAWGLLLLAGFLGLIFAWTRSKRDLAGSVLAAVGATSLLIAVTSATVGVALVCGLASVWLASPFLAGTLIDGLDLGR